MIPRFRPTLGMAEMVAALRPARQDDIEMFEAAFAEAAGQRHAIAFPYGRTALLVLLSALGIVNRRIICPAYTCVVVPHAIIVGGNTPYFVDASADANMNLTAAETALTQNTAALIATSIFGHPVDLDRLEEIARRNPDLAIIQDCAHSFAASWKGQLTNKAGLAAIFGLNASKILTSIFGGMVTTDNDAVNQAVRMERARLISPAPLTKSVARTLYLIAIQAAFWPPLFGLTETLRKAGLLDRFTRYYDEAVIDFPADHAIALTQVEARVGEVQAHRLGDFITARRAYADYYRHHLSHLQNWRWIDCASGSSYSHIAARVADRGYVMRAAAERGVQLGEVIEYSIPELAAYRQWGDEQGPFPVARDLARATINLPVSGKFDARAAEKTVAVVNNIMHNQPPASPLPDGLS